MKVTYRLKKSYELSKDPTGSDKNKRDKVEEALGKKLSDTEWFNYKLMLLPKYK